MSRINIKGIIRGIRSKTNVYTPIIEAIVNAIDAIDAAERNSAGIVRVVLKRSRQTSTDGSLGDIQDIDVIDNGTGFTQACRDSFDTYLSESKLAIGGKGFGRFMYAKYFDHVKVESIYKGAEGLRRRAFVFGREHDIIVGETDKPETNELEIGTTLHLIGLTDVKYFDKELATVAKRIAEKILPFMVNDGFTCPVIIVQEQDEDHQIVLNHYVQGAREIIQLGSRSFDLDCGENETETFTVKVYKIYSPGSTVSKISLTGNSREVVETSLSNYVSEFEDEFFDETTTSDGKAAKRNYIIKAYVYGGYLDRSVDIEREGFVFDDKRPTAFHPIPRMLVESEAAAIAQDIMGGEITSRIERKKQRITTFVHERAPWHIPMLKDVDFTKISYSVRDENIEAELQRQKFLKEQEIKKDIRNIIADEEAPYDEKLAGLLSKITDIGKSDLAHYVANRKVVIDAFNGYRKRRSDGKAEVEKELHQLIYPMGSDSVNTAYENHNLWLIDERLVFSQYVASDIRIGKSKGAGKEPDLLIFNTLRSYRHGENEYSNPITIYEFKRPKRADYEAKDDPIIQVGKYVELIRAGRYETPGGVEPVKANDNTPVYAYVVSDLTIKIHEFAKNHQLTLSPDQEGYFGFHKGYKMYVEILSFKKLYEDAAKRNSIFFKKLGLI